MEPLLCARWKENTRWGTKDIIPQATMSSTIFFFHVTLYGEIKAQNGKVGFQVRTPFKKNKIKGRRRTSWEIERVVKKGKKE